MSDINILVIDDQYGSSEGFKNGFLEKVGAFTDKNEPVEGYPYNFTFHSGQDENKKNSLKAVEEKIRERWPAVDGSRWAIVLLDVRFDQKPGNKNDENFGFELLGHLRDTFDANLPVIMLTSEDESKRRKANIAAANGFLPKNTLSQEALINCVTYHGLIPDMRSCQYRLIGHSLPLLKTLREARRYAIKPLGGRIIYGETGSGKTELARYAHDFSNKPGEFRSWTVVPHGDPSLIKDALFGHWKGAFGGADSSQAGEIESAHMGTFLLDEIADLPYDAQSFLLEFRRRVEGGNRIVSRMGRFPRRPQDIAEARGSVRGVLRGDHKILIDVLLLTATNKPLYDKNYRDQIRFRDDLYEDLGSQINFPSLNERRMDIREIFLWFTSNFVNEQKEPITVSSEVLNLLVEHDWKNSNIVGLKRIAELAVSNLGDFNEILPHHLSKDIWSEGRLAGTSKTILEVIPSAEDVNFKQPSAAKRAVKTTVTLQDLADILNTLTIDKDDHALKGAKPRLEEAFQSMMRHLAGAALERCRDPLTKQFNRQSAMRLLTGDESLKGKGPGRVLNEIIGRKQENEIKDEELEKLVAEWKASLKSTE